MKRLARGVDQLPASREPNGGIEFFIERLLCGAVAGRDKVA